MTRWLLPLYKRAVSPALHALAGCTGACRFQPTCSEYAALALATYGPLRGGWLALYRVLRCQPFSRGGFDPVPGTGFDPTLRDAIQGARPANQGDERGRKTGADGLMHLP